MIEYIIVTAQSIEDLVQCVNDMVANGFEPIGGVAVEVLRGIPFNEYYQAMVRCGN